MALYLEITVQGNKLIGEPVKKKYSLKELLQKVDNANLHSETSAGGLTVGNEI